MKEEMVSFRPRECLLHIEQESIMVHKKNANEKKWKAIADPLKRLK